MCPRRYHKLDVGGRAYIKSPWALNYLNDHNKIADTVCPFFTQITGVPQGSTEGGLSWLVITDILLKMMKLHKLSDIYIPDAKDRLFRQYLTQFADNTNAYAAFQRYTPGEATTLSLCGTRDSTLQNGGQRVLHRPERVSKHTGVYITRRDSDDPHYN